MLRRTMAFRISAALGAACAAISLAACGGGGSGGGGQGGITGFPAVPQQVAGSPPAAEVPTPEVVPAPPAGAAPTPPAGAAPVVSTVALTGRATYDAVPNRSGPLVYADTVAKPVRAASVEVVDANGALSGVATTDDNGAYTVTVPARTMLTVRVYARLLRSGAGPGWDVSVRDNTKENALYSMESVAFPSGTAALTHDLHAASGWGGTAYTGLRVAAPFAVVDTIYTAMQKVRSVAPATQFPALKVFWSSNNLPAEGNLAIGQITTSKFVDKPGSAEMYLLGKENVDTDEFDSSVIAHEWGHYYQAVFSRNSSTGGLHGSSERLDRRIALSEGWGNGWSGIALGRSNYADSNGAQQAKGFALDLSRGLVDNPGWYREGSVQSIFWNLNAQVGFKPIHDALTSAQFRTRAPLTSIHAFAAAFNAVAPGIMPVLAALLRAQGISDAPNDPWGRQETNAGGLPAVPNALPMYIEVLTGAATAACVSNVASTANKLGNFTYFHFTAPASGNYQWALVPSTPGANLAIAFYRGGALPQYSRAAAVQPVSFVQLAADTDYVAAVQDNNGTSACFNLTIQQGPQP
ncbi:MAG: hypothetical protein JWO98_5355 [Frankiales bacterium]|nr:hypothetical protein [Frankiales bacterium]